MTIPFLFFSVKNQLKKWKLEEQLTFLMQKGKKSKFKIKKKKKNLFFFLEEELFVYLITEKN
jgi:hypothetical protein